MKILLLTLTLTFCFQTFAQKEDVNVQTFSIIRQLDSLYRNLCVYYPKYILINYKKNIIEINEEEAIFNIQDSLAIKQYCNQKNLDFIIFQKIINLLITNNLISIEKVGPGDCLDCSHEIVYKISNETVYSFVLIELKNRCMPADCYDDLTYNPRTKKFKKANSKNLTDDILLVKRHIIK